MDVDLIRKKYLENVPLGYTKEEIQRMPDVDILDMDYFENEDNLFSSFLDLEPSVETVLFICKKCKCEENIPKNIVDMLDKQDSR